MERRPGKGRTEFLLFPMNLLFVNYTVGHILPSKGLYLPKEILTVLAGIVKDWKSGLGLQKHGCQPTDSPGSSRQVALCK